MDLKALEDTLKGAKQGVKTAEALNNSLLSELNKAKSKLTDQERKVFDERMSGLMGDMTKALGDIDSDKLEKIQEKWIRVSS